MNTIALLNSTGGPSSSTLVYHLSAILADSGHRVMVLDLDPQVRLSRLNFEEQELESAWSDRGGSCSLFGALSSALGGCGAGKELRFEQLQERLACVPGDPRLVALESAVSDVWRRYDAAEPSAIAVVDACQNSLLRSAERFEADCMLLDLGTHLGGLTRLALGACRHMVISVVPDLIAWTGLKIMGPMLREWARSYEPSIVRREGGEDRANHFPRPIGYVVMPRQEDVFRHPFAEQVWVDRFPSAFREFILNDASPPSETSQADPFCLGRPKLLRALLPLALRARKPVFCLKPADGAIGAYGEAVGMAHRELKQLAAAIESRLTNDPPAG